MPIYAYKCESCGHAKDVLQKMSDDPLTNCPACGGGGFKKQLTAAGFHLKGSGWYATDFKGGSGAGAPAAADGEAPEGAGDAVAAPAAAPGTASSTTPAAPTPTASASCGSSCACH
ncbi:MAG: zinc ribbon domain-containing protein [Burkholderiales bacterium]|nr:zinc ribbon domain-containing protein [Burkholderiales bacterium]